MDRPSERERGKEKNQLILSHSRVLFMRFAQNHLEKNEGSHFGNFIKFLKRKCIKNTKKSRQKSEEK